MIFSNPEFLRNARGQLRPRKLLAAATICAAVSISVAYLFIQNNARASDPTEWGKELLQFSLYAQAIVLAVGGGIACLNTIHREKEQNTFDYQRVTRLSPFELTLGKLFGAPVMMYFVTLCLMPLSLIAALAAKANLVFFLVA